jgi:hypothetical protein
MAPQSSLAAKSCTPCRGGVPPLAPEEVSAHQRQTPEWRVQDEAQRIERTFKFRNFAEAFGFVRQVADLAGRGRGITPVVPTVIVRSGRTAHSWHMEGLTFLGRR